MKLTLRQQSMKALANKIVNELFVNGAKEHATTLQLYDKNGRNLGGWGLIPMRDSIRKILLANRPMTHKFSMGKGGRK